MSKQVCIGSSMTIEGELTGKEDLIIDGKVKGKILVTGHQLTIGENGHVSAEIHDASRVVVQGEMVGDISADDKIEIETTGSMLGNIRAPRVVLAEGSRFKGSIDMEPKSAPTRGSASPSKTPEEPGL